MYTTLCNRGPSCNAKQRSATERSAIIESKFHRATVHRRLWARSAECCFDPRSAASAACCRSRFHHFRDGVWLSGFSLKGFIDGQEQSSAASHCNGWDVIHCAPQLRCCMLKAPRPSPAASSGRGPLDTWERPIGCPGRAGSHMRGCHWAGSSGPGPPQLEER